LNCVLAHSGTHSLGMLSFMSGRKSVGPANGAAPSPQKSGSVTNGGAAPSSKELCPLGRLLLNDLEALRTDSSRKFAKLREASTEATRYLSYSEDRSNICHAKYLSIHFRRLIQELAGFGSASSDRTLADELKSRPAIVKPVLMACEIKKFQAIGMQLLSRLATHDALDPANFAGVGPVLRASAEVTCTDFTASFAQRCPKQDQDHSPVFHFIIAVSALGLLLLEPAIMNL
jgi:hypothetical protein